MVEKGQLCADSSKVAALKDWPVPTTRKQLQRFLGFANFYRRFIRNYSRLAAPLTHVMSPKPTFVWSPVEQQAFDKLKNMFVNAPVLMHPDPEWQFVVEVDVLDSGVGAILSQRHPTDNKLHPCVFFLRRLSRNQTMTWGTGNSWRWSWLFRSGGTGWKEGPNLSLCGQTTKISPTCALLTF